MLLLAQTLGRHAQHAYSTGLELRRALVEHDAVGLFQRHQGYLTGTAEQIIISFAGSRSAESTFGLVDWCDNLTARLDEHACGRVHSGCHRQVQFYLKEEMLRGLEKLYTGQTILLTGHSRGGALALLAAHELQQAGFQQVAVFMFGAPKVGDQTFADSCGFPVYRIECEGDPVPLLPPLEGYVAVGSSIWLADDG
ncbi:MAG: Mbeg1-like protein, partial [Thermomicrobiales bacterium]